MNPRAHCKMAAERKWRRRFIPLQLDQMNALYGTVLRVVLHAQRVGTYRSFTGRCVTEDTITRRVTGRGPGSKTSMEAGLESKACLGSESGNETGIIIYID
ncbi:hypothetical protein EVAR_62084_1 [Eumeta japonica]|uniref:Uncharacterized protein n=1 Tax=Eumeta variegata TaxID=151549 RepID=A0A4C1Z4M1_EUMVA|nr:hypothetical protein EVAR_62084_1 [Eumeta japonica]